MDKALYGRDQYGQTWGPIDPRRPRKSLLELTGRRSLCKMYVDTRDGRPLHIGYVVNSIRKTGEPSLWIELTWHHPWARLA